MLALPALAVVPAPATDAASLLVAGVVVVAILVLVSIALDLRKLRRASRLRAIHGVLGAAFSIVVVGGALAMSMALGSASTATAGQDVAPVITHEMPVAVPEPLDTSDVTDPSTDIQLPTLGAE
jgi:drug/metabolite transporter (DMT)-like permease